MILGLSYKLKMNKEIFPSVSRASDKALATQHSMYELGNVIPWIIWNITKGPDTVVLILISKIDLKNGYWHIVFNEGDTRNFAYVLIPLNPDDGIKLVMPGLLQMGWSNIPTFFCAATEIMRDIVESNFPSATSQQVHPDIKLGQYSNTKGSLRTK